MKTFKLTKERFLVIIILLIYTNIFGIYRLPSIFGQNLNDLSLTMLIVYFFYFVYSYKKLFAKLTKSTISKNIFIFLLIVIGVAFSMIFRETGTFYSGIKIGKLFFILLIFLPVYVDIFENNNYNFWSKLILYLGLWYSFIVFLNFLSPSFANSIFKAIVLNRSDDIWGTTSTRYVVKSNYGILFIHVSFLISASKLLLRKNKLDAFFIILTAGLLMQGWRAILVSTIISFIVSLIFFKIKVSYKQIIKYSLVVIIFSIPIDIVTNNTISSKFISARNELRGDQEGTFIGRYKRAEIFAIPEFLSRPLWGHGFIKQESPKKGIMELSHDKTYLLYNFDFGYLTMLIMFGIILFVIILYLFLQILYRLTLKNLKIHENNGEFLLVFFIFFLSLLIANYSFGGLISAVGLLPLGILAGIGLAKYLDIYKILPY